MTSFVPARLALLHRNTPVGDRVQVERPRTYDDQRWADVLDGAGFDSEGTRLWSLADSVRPDMTMLVCGLNPSPASADAAVGFARPGNRFWPALIEAGLTTVDRDPIELLRRRIGMTDLVKRTTRRADELSRDEYTAGVARVERLVAWLEPSVICFVGLAGWRTAVDRNAVAGQQPSLFGGRPAYVMPSTSGLNASSQLPDLANHLATASRLGVRPQGVMWRDDLAK